VGGDAKLEPFPRVGFEKGRVETLPYGYWKRELYEPGLMVPVGRIGFKPYPAETTVLMPRINGPVVHQYP
jgi:hypothetical protein